LSLAKLTVLFEPVDGELSILTDLDEVAIGMTHVTAPFPAIRIGNGAVRKNAPLSPPFLVAAPDVRDLPIKEAIDSVQIRRCFKKDLWLVGS
jgi:hypothetical protein